MPDYGTSSIWIICNRLQLFKVPSYSNNTVLFFHQEIADINRDLFLEFLNNTTHAIFWWRRLVFDYWLGGFHWQVGSIFLRVQPTSLNTGQIYQVRGSSSGTTDSLDANLYTAHEARDFLEGDPGKASAIRLTNFARFRRNVTLTFRDVKRSLFSLA